MVVLAADAADIPSSAEHRVTPSADDNPTRNDRPRTPTKYGRVQDGKGKGKGKGKEKRRSLLSLSRPLSRLFSFKPDVTVESEVKGSPYNYGRDRRYGRYGHVLESEAESNRQSEQLFEAKQVVEPSNARVSYADFSKRDRPLQSPEAPPSFQVDHSRERNRRTMSDLLDPGEFRWSDSKTAAQSSINSQDGLNHVVDIDPTNSTSVVTPEPVLDPPTLPPLLSYTDMHYEPLRKAVLPDDKPQTLRLNAFSVGTDAGLRNPSIPYPVRSYNGTNQDLSTQRSIDLEGLGTAWESPDLDTYHRGMLRRPLSISDRGSDSEASTAVDEVNIVSPLQGPRQESSPKHGSLIESGTNPLATSEYLNGTQGHQITININSSNDPGIFDKERTIQRKTKELVIQGEEEGSLRRLEKSRRYERERKPATYGWNLEHFTVTTHDDDPVITYRFLGHGSLGIVEEVRRSNTQFPTFVRKRVQLPARKREAKATLEIIQEEAKNLRSLVHPHIVTLIGTYEEMKHVNAHFYFLLMSPVGETDLKRFLDYVGDEEPASQEGIQWKGWISKWFACLASALAYMHESGIRHQDIKPSNIIHKGDDIYFTDFSSSSTFEVGRTTSTENPARTSYMYAAPELTAKLAGSRERHGRASDIFALGCVFCDMLTVLTDRTVSSFHEYLLNDGETMGEHAGPSHNQDPLYYSHRTTAIEKWFALSKHHPFYLALIKTMLASNRDSRPSAPDILKAALVINPAHEQCEGERKKDTHASSKDSILTGSADLTRNLLIAAEARSEKLAGLAEVEEEEPIPQRAKYGIQFGK
jgi:serine/threonine protein kinase